MTSWPQLVEGEKLLPDPDDAELYYRAANPDQVDEAEFSTAVFSPGLWALSSAERSPGDAKLSGTRETLQTPAGLLGERPSAVAVAGVTVAEIVDCGLRAVDDSELVADTTGHTYIDFRLAVREARAARRATRERLTELANLRGPQ